MTTDTPIWKSGVILALIAAVCTALVAITWTMTRERIAENQTAWLERSMQPALAGVFFDSAVTESLLTVQPPHDLPGNQAALIYRVYAADEPVAALFAVTARDGYSGPIRLLIGIAMDGTVTGVRVVEHRETPGLGDKIEITKSDWVLQFDGHSLGNPELSGWAIKGDGGQFDQLTGASITPRAIINAITQTLQYFELHKTAIFAAPSDDSGDEVSDEIE